MYITNYNNNQYTRYYNYKNTVTIAHKDYEIERQYENITYIKHPIDPSIDRSTYPFMITAHDNMLTIMYLDGHVSEHVCFNHNLDDLMPSQFMLTPVTEPINPAKMIILDTPLDIIYAGACLEIVSYKRTKYHVKKVVRTQYEIIIYACETIKFVFERNKSIIRVHINDDIYLLK